MIQNRSCLTTARVAICAVTLLSSAPSGHTETLVKRGEYLVNAVMACDNCHTPRTPKGLDMTRRFSGGSLVWDEESFKVKGSNITPDITTGIGVWSDAEIKRALTEGVRPDETPLAPIMPFAFYRILTVRDLDAIVAYMRTIPPQKNESEPPAYKADMPSINVPGGEKPMSEQDLNNTLKRGFYLATIAHCMECHAHDANGIHDLKANLGGGGHVFRGPWGEVATPNITSHPVAGIGGWSDEEIKIALREGKGRDGHKFKVPMARANYFSRMTETDLDALVAYIRTLPPLEQKNQ